MVYICIRRTLDWSDEATFDAQLDPAFRPKVDVWNATFSIPYHLFRHRLKAIAQSNLYRVDGAIVADFAKVPPGELIVPVDDDDWFAPDLVLRLRRAYTPAARGYLWRRDVLELPPAVSRRPRLKLRTGLGLYVRVGRLRARVSGVPADPVICKTNNYAFRNVPEASELHRNHLTASRYFTTHASEIQRLDATLGVQNRNLASQTALGYKSPVFERDELIASFLRYRRLYRSWRVPTEIRWARPYIEHMAELMDDFDLK